MSYHLKQIEKGIFGEFSKIREEFEESQDGFNQQNPVMVLIELSDLVGAIEAYVINWHNISLEDLIKMKNATNRAFQSGHRVSNDPVAERPQKKVWISPGVSIYEKDLSRDGPDRGYGPGLGGFTPGGFSDSDGK